MSYEDARIAWDELRDIPVNRDGEIGEQFKDFSIGTEVEEIWYWFEEHFDVSVYKLMHPRK